MILIAPFDRDDDPLRQQGVKPDRIGGFNRFAVK
jgi:hypothetical protein